MTNFTVIYIRKTYKEALNSSFITTSKVEYMADPDVCVLEVLTNAKRRIYLDIECIPNDKPEMINDIVTSFIAFMQLPSDTKYTLTMNAASANHSGLSYHVILPYAMDYLLLKRCVAAFKVKHPEYEKYVDQSVYSHNRLFRLPEQGKPTGQGIDNDDKHVIIQGSMDDSFIQVIDGLPEIGTIPKEILDIQIPHKQNGPKSNHINIDDKFAKIDNKIDTLISKIEELLSRFTSK